MRAISRGAPFALVLALVLLAGCGAGRAPVGYEDGEGFHFTPPPGWSERARPAASAPRALPRRQANLPLPPLGVPGGPREERLLVRYDRLTAGRQAWVRVTVAEVPASVSLPACLSRPPRADWRREGEVESLEVAGLPAARVAFRGCWDNQDYLNETAAVRKGSQAYFITASFPAADETAREQVRQAVAGITWR